MRRFPMIDGLRLLAAALVLVSHVAFWTGASALDTSGPLLARGDSGVAIFFAISAFLLLRPYVDHEVDLRRYAVHRSVRILPAYWVALVAVLAVVRVRTGRLGDPADVVAHVLLLQGYTGADYQAFTQTWSLTTEVTFYVLVPVIGPAFGRLIRRDPDAALRSTLIVAVGGFGAQAIATWGTVAGHTTWPGVLATSVLGHAAWFAVGALCLVLGSSVSLSQPAFGPIRALGAGRLAAVALVVYLLASLPWAGPVDLTAPSVAESVVKEVLYTLLAGLLLLASTRVAADSAARAVHRSPALRFAGDLSYGVFLWHVLVLQLLHLLVGRPLFSGGFGWMLFAVVTVTAMAAYASASLIEQPVLRRWAASPTSAPPQAKTSLAP